MSHFEDLSPLGYFGAEYSDVLRAIGWLEPGHNYTRGHVEREFFERLCELLQRPWSPVHFMGAQDCGFCRFTGGNPTQLQRKTGLVRIPGHSCLNLFVPGDGVIYASPELIAHYIDAHEYRPPDEFMESVLRCPRMNSKEYFGAMRANGWEFSSVTSQVAGT